MTVEPNGRVIVTDAQDGIPGDLVDIHKNPGSHFAAHQADAFSQKHLDATVRHIAEVHAELLFLIHDLGDDVSGDDVRHHVGMSNLDAFRRNLHNFISFC